MHLQEVLEKCSLVKDLEMLPFGDLTPMTVGTKTAWKVLRARPLLEERYTS
uniref:Uncharacterized protein n=1 Tax=Nelumbo nucifera TaxID=4432 RepID=A0A822ZCI4_NELNU|nr:TPA_asm: hypothetical protein HUJ06_013571 [Nelumbo nucifera]